MSPFLASDDQSSFRRGNSVARFGLAGLTLCVLFHVIYSIFFVASLIILIQRGGRLMWLCASTIILFICTTAFLAVELSLTDTAAESSIPSSIPTILLALVTILTAEIIIIHRCYVIWGRRKVSIGAPVCSAVVSIGCSVAGTALLMRARRVAESPEALQFIKSSRILFGISTAAMVVTSLLSTTLAAGRIFWLSRQVAPGVSRKMYCTISALIMESGMIYTITEVVFFILYLLSVYRYVDVYHALEVAAILVVETAGIAPTLLIVRSAYPYSLYTPTLPSSTALAAKPLTDTAVLDTLPP